MSSEVCIVIHYAMTLCIYQILVATPRRRGQTVASRLWLCIFKQSLRDWPHNSRFATVTLLI